MIVVNTGGFAQILRTFYSFVLCSTFRGEGAEFYHTKEIKFYQKTESNNKIKWIFSFSQFSARLGGLKYCQKYIQWIFAASFQKNSSKKLENPQGYLNIWNFTTRVAIKTCKKIPANFSHRQGLVLHNNLLNFQVKRDRDTEARGMWMKDCGPWGSDTFFYNEMVWCYDDLQKWCCLAQ